MRKRSFIFGSLTSNLIKNKSINYVEYKLLHYEYGASKGVDYQSMSLYCLFPNAIDQFTLSVIKLVIALISHPKCHFMADNANQWENGYQNEQ